MPEESVKACLGEKFHKFLVRKIEKKKENDTVR